MEFILKDGTKVKEGDLITLTKKSHNAFSSFTFEATLEQLENLVQMGVVKKVNEPELSVGTLSYYTTKLIDKYSDTFSILPLAIRFSMLLKEIAIDIDKSYPDHIKKSKDLFIISNLDGQIHQVNSEYLKNFLHFAAFRSKKDAKIAYNIVKPYISQMFNES